MTLWDKVDGEAELAFEVVTTLGDHLAYNSWLRRRPEWRRRRTNIILLYALLVPLMALVAGFALRVALQGTSCDLDDALGDAGRARIVLVLAGSIALGEALLGMGLFVWRRTSTEPSVRAQLQRRPGVDPRDPQLRERNMIAIHASGYRIATDAAAHAYSWTVTRSFDETVDHLFLMADTQFGFIVPKRDLPPATILALRDTMRAFNAAKARCGSPA